MKNQVIVIISLLVIILLVSGSGCLPAPSAPENKSNMTAQQNQGQAQSQVQAKFAAQMQSIVFDSQYTASHYSTYSSSGGTRILNITYIIKNKTIVYCDGAFTSFMTDRPNDNIVCDIATLKIDGYNAGPNYFTQEKIFERIKDFQPAQLSSEGDKSCFSTDENKVCFRNSKIVAYVSIGNPAWDWNVIG